jgi:hypothetical protein
MTTLVTTPVAGLEEIQRAAFYVFFESFNDVLAEVAGYWATRDTDFDRVTGRSLAPTELEPIPNDNFHEGHKPSLIRSLPDNYPNLAVFAMRASPSSEDASFDQISSWSDSILVEIMVKANEEDEEIVNRRCQRTAEAAMISLSLNPTLGGAVTGLETNPTVNVSDVFAVTTDTKVPASGSYGERFIWQGASIQYTIRKDSERPGPLGAIFSRASQTDYSQFIDQG